MTDTPETHVLAIASHVTYGYVGNTMATFVMQSLGMDVSAINTVNFSNHTAYRQVKGRKTPHEEVEELYEGLKQSGLDDFDMMLSGYCPSAEVVNQVGRIARDRRLSGATKPGSFFWVLDPVMGDNGQIYVNEDTVPAYKALVRDADLILPNQFEVELLSGVTITDHESLTNAIRTLHIQHRIPHIIITSVRLPSSDTQTSASEELSVIGSTATSTFQPRLFRISAPALPVFFSGTGDMFAALTVARLRQTAQEADLLDQRSWVSPDDVQGTDLPLARAAQMVIASMHAVLEDTMVRHDEAVRAIDEGQSEVGQKKRHLRLTKAAEVRVVRNVDKLRNPPDLDRFVPLAFGDEGADLGQGLPVPDELGVLKMGLGAGEDGATHQV